jgi:hypothetical protein
VLTFDLFAGFPEMKALFIKYCKPPLGSSLVGNGGHTLLLRGGLRGFDPRQLRRTKRAFRVFPLAI